MTDAIVGGSNSTVWQPATPQNASVTIDIGKQQEISKVMLNCVWHMVKDSPHYWSRVRVDREFSS
ncbi:hypothetical protein J3E68DRAFT_407212 [Trichoderma sp. SZMC 28012]